MERIRESKLITYLLGHDLINADQHGFIQSKTCSPGMTDFLNMSTKFENGAKSVVVIFLDMMKAFHRVYCYEILIKVKSCCIKTVLLALLSSHLTSRIKVVNVNGTLSRPFPITS